MRHSAVWVCIPLPASMTRNIKSMIWAPPITVRIKEAEKLRKSFCERLLIHTEFRCLFMKIQNIGKCITKSSSGLPWPGQSTSVYWTLPNLSLRWSGLSTAKELKPRSRVIPRSLDWGFLSKAAVLAMVLILWARDVLPLKVRNMYFKYSNFFKHEFIYLVVKLEQF